MSDLTTQSQPVQNAVNLFAAAATANNEFGLSQMEMLVLQNSASVTANILVFNGVEPDTAAQWVREAFEMYKGLDLDYEAQKVLVEGLTALVADDLLALIETLPEDQVTIDDDDVALVGLAIFEAVGIAVAISA